MRFFKNPLNGFKYAIEGVVHVLRTQRHMRFHFLTLLLVLIVSLVFNLSRTEVMVLLFTISLVLTAEMFNTAIEAVTDLVTQTYHPLAKFAKDIAAGAVLITTINALAIGFLLFMGGNRDVLTDENISKVSIVGLGMRSHAGVATKMFQTLSKEGINIQMISTSEIKISVVVDAKYTELAVRVLHDAFELSGKDVKPERQ